MKVLSPAWLVGVVLAAAACGSDNGGTAIDGGTMGPRDATDPGDGGGGCAVEPTFASIHAKILRDTRCTICHGAAPAPAGGGYAFPADKAMAYTFILADTGDVSRTPPKRVVANNPDMSSFYLKLLSPPPYGSRMPQEPLDPLPACEIEAVRTWIQNGAAND